MLLREKHIVRPSGLNQGVASFYYDKLNFTMPKYSKALTKLFPAFLLCVPLLSGCDILFDKDYTCLITPACSEDSSDGMGVFQGIPCPESCDRSMQETITVGASGMSDARELCEENENSNGVAELCNSYIVCDCKLSD